MKQFLLTPIITLLITMMVMGQNTGLSFSIEINDCDKASLENVDSPAEVEANFRVNKTFGPAPMTVNFTDLSQGDAIGWVWNFGDGTVDSVQNPVHTYNMEGIYTVKLSVYDADSVVSVDSRADFIRVVGYGLCDSVNYDIPGNYYLYQLPGAETGYLSGNNSRGDLAKASFFSVSENKGMLMGGLFYFAIRETGLASNPDIIFKAWDNDGPAGTPGTVLDTYSISLSDIPVDDLGTGLYPATIPFFDEWVSIDEDFYLGFELPQTQGDTLAIFTNRVDDVLVGNGWEQTASGAWQTYETGTPGYKVDNAIFPIICQPTGIDNHLLNNDVIIYPIPATEQIFVTYFKNQQEHFNANILDLSGRLVLQSTDMHSGASINVSQLSPGLYILQLENDSGVMSHKIMIE